MALVDEWMESTIESCVKGDIGCRICDGGTHMEDKCNWLVDIFLEYQEALDERRKIFGDRLWFKEALADDRANRSRGFNSAAAPESF